MRKTRLVILPTKCLHQMGFLLLFLSCPVIGDWGRIRPESENSHNAIQIDREGTCGFERDPPGGLVDFLNENGSRQCRLSKDLDSITLENKPVDITQTRKSAQIRDDVRRVGNQRNVKMSERRMINERTVRETLQRRLSDERNIRNVHRRDTRNEIRSRSVESRRSSNRNDVRIRSVSSGRLESERMGRNIRQNAERNLRKDGERLLLTRRLSERQSDRRTEQERRTGRGISNERRENERKIQTASERRERENSRAIQSESETLRRDINRSSQERSLRRERDTTRRRDVRERTDRRLSLARREQNDARRIEIKKNFDEINSERRAREIRRTRSLEYDGAKSARMNMFEPRRETANRRFVSLSPKLSERNVRERMALKHDRINGIKFRRSTEALASRNVQETSEIDLSIKKTEDKHLLDGMTKWMDLKSYDKYTTGDWTTNCVIGAVVYYFTTRRVKSV